MIIRQYPDYKESHVEGLGVIPTDWVVTRLKHLGSIKYGIGEPPTYVDEGIPLIRATNVSRGLVTPEKMAFVDPEDIPASRILWLRRGDIIVVRSGALTGDSALIREDYAGSIAGFDMVFRASPAALPDFLQYALLTPYVKEAQIDISRMRAAQPHLNAEELGDCLIALPSLDEQYAIAEYLDNETSEIDAFIADQEVLIGLLNERRAATITQAVTKGTDLNVPMKESGVEWLDGLAIPAGWTVWKLGRLIRMKSGDALTSESIESVGTFPVYGGGGFRGYTETYTNDGDHVLIGRQGALCGNIKRANGKFFATEHSVVTYPQHPVSTTWLASVLEVMNLGQYSQSAAQPGISVEVIGQKRLPVPPYEEQLDIAEYLEGETAEIDAAIADAREAIALSKERRDAVISAAVTGKIDVSDAYMTERTIIQGEPVGVA